MVGLLSGGSNDRNCSFRAVVDEGFGETMESTFSCRDPSSVLRKFQSCHYFPHFRFHLTFSYSFLNVVSKGH